MYCAIGGLILFFFDSSSLLKKLGSSLIKRLIPHARAGVCLRYGEAATITRTSMKFIHSFIHSLK